MLTSEADQSIISDLELSAETSSVKRGAIMRQKERERLRNSIIELRNDLVSLKK